MAIFSAEFPVKLVPTRAHFVAQVFAWLRGIQNSTVLDAAADTDLGKEYVYLRSAGGEELHLRELGKGDGFDAIGFRHDIPDQEGRVWRTEVVLRRSSGVPSQDVFRLRTQCIAREAGARIHSPRKPYLIKAVLQDGWGGVDGAFVVSDEPHWLAGDQASLETARAITRGEASRHLPTIYVSASGSSQWLISRDDIRKLAFDLGGVAHVVVEPDRGFSFRLKDETDGTNAYGGAIGVVLPGRPLVRRFYLGWQFEDVAELLAAVRETALDMRSWIPAVGWDWTELQEQALRVQRERDRSKLSDVEYGHLLEQEIANLQDRIKQLEAQLTERQPNVPDSHDIREAPLADLVKGIGPEVYPGELSDRMRLAAKLALSTADREGLDGRSRAVFDIVVNKLRSSPGLAELREDLSRATKDPKRVADDLARLLSRHGRYSLKSNNKHPRLEPDEDFAGLGTITSINTPSDYRGLRNLKSQVEGALGLVKLAE